jgi:hypothetical protein
MSAGMDDEFLLDDDEVLPERPKCGLMAYEAGLRRPILGRALRVGEVWFLSADSWPLNMKRVTLTCHVDGISVVPLDGSSPHTVSWSPFSVAQASRLQNTEADLSRPSLRVFRLIIFHHGVTFLFAVEGKNAEAERMEWLAEMACALRTLTKSLFPVFGHSVMPLRNAPWTATRLLAGFLLMCDEFGVSVIYAELHCHWNRASVLVGYEDEYCETRVLNVPLDTCTFYTELMGVDCSCFSLDDRYYFCTRSVAERSLWLRALSNLKMKLWYSQENPTAADMSAYRWSIRDCISQLPDHDDFFPQKEMLPQRSVSSLPLIPRQRMPRNPASQWVVFDSQLPSVASERTEQEVSQAQQLANDVDKQFGERRYAEL